MHSISDCNFLSIGESVNQSINQSIAGGRGAYKQGFYGMLYVMLCYVNVRCEHDGVRKILPVKGLWRAPGPQNIDDIILLVQLIKIKLFD